MKARTLVPLAVLLLVSVQAANAALFKVTFEATDFSPIFSSIPAPTDPVIGYLIYEAPTQSGVISDIASVSLEIDGHEYWEYEIMHWEWGNAITTFGAGILPSDALSVVAGRSDFMFAVRRDLSMAAENSQFTYASVNYQNTWWESSFAGFSATIEPVPEPSTLLLAGLGFLSMPLLRRRAKSR